MFVVDGPDSLPGIEGPDVVTIFARAGKGVGSLFRTSRSPAPKSTPEPDHSVSYGVVYANEIAAPEMEKSAPKFPAGSILVRERLESPTASDPTLLIAMVKRQRDFSKATGDWEFLMLNGSDMKLLSRQTAGNCADCHAKAQKTDWVFIDQLKK